jgi:anti-sigma B factor antagonist
MSESMTINSELNDGIAVVRVAGTLDTQTTLSFRSQCLDALSEATEGLIIDISGVNFVASSGLGTFLLVNETGRTAGCPVIIAGASESVMEVLAMMNLDQFLNLQADLESAHQAVKLCSGESV